jgi:cytochrome bd-type quinol oxidase subunit 2
MFKTLKKLLVATSMLGMFLAPVLAVGSAAAALPAPGLGSDCSSGAGSINGCLSAGTCLSTTDTTCDSGTPASTRVDTIIHLVINLFSLVVGVISVIMIIVGGLKYITSSGDSANVTGAKNTILYAIIGLVIVALAQVIARFVLQKVNG